MEQLDEKSNDVNSLKELVEMHGSLLAKQGELLARLSRRLDLTNYPSSE